MDATPFMPKYQIPCVNQTFFDADKALRDAATSSAQDFLDTIEESIDHETLSKFNITAPQVVEGIIASGDKFVSTAEDLKDLHPQVDTKAVEMEGAAVAQVCTSFNIPFVIIRTISDKANSDSHVDFPAFVSSVASVYSFEILSRMIRSLRPESIICG
jgi:adenosylhomocysteine nucleosidase